MKLITLIVTFFTFSASLFAGEFENLVQALPIGNYSDRAAVIEQIIESDDKRSIEILQSLGDGKLLFAETEGLMLIEDDNGFRDALSGEIRNSEISAKKIKVNNKLRGVIDQGLVRKLHYSDDPKLRFDAAAKAFDNPDPARLSLLQDLRSKETDAKVQSELDGAIAASLLASDASVEEKRAAIAHLVKFGQRAQSTLLVAVDNPELADAYGNAMDLIAKQERVRQVGQNLWYGVSLGSVLLLAAIGLAITFGVMGVINMAHGELIMVGAYVTFVVQEVFRNYLPDFIGYALFVAIPLAFIVAGLIGVIIERGVVRHLYGRPLETLLATWGVSLILQQATRTIFGPNNRQVSNPEWMSGSVEFIGLNLTWNRIWILLFAIAIFGGLLWFMKKTSFGMHIRAVTQNRPMAANMGISTSWVDSMAFGLGAGIAGLAGVALSQIDNVSPNLGQGYIVDSFMVVVFGGAGNLWGTVMGAFSLGIANKFLEPFAGAVLAKILILVGIILFIQRKPRGLFAVRGRFVE